MLNNKYFFIVLAIMAALLAVYTHVSDGSTLRIAGYIALACYCSGWYVYQKISTDQ